MRKQEKDGMQNRVKVIKRRTRDGEKLHDEIWRCSEGVMETVTREKWGDDWDSDEAAEECDEAFAHAYRVLAWSCGVSQCPEAKSKLFQPNPIQRRVEEILNERFGVRVAKRW